MSQIDLVHHHVPQIDWDTLYARFPGKPHVVDRLIRTLIAGDGQTPELIRNALTAGDLPSAARHAHTVKGMAANMMAGQLSQLATQAELAVRDNRPEASHLLKTLAAELDRLVDNLKTCFDSQSQS